MKKSITKRMFLGIVAVVIGFAIILMLANSLLLSPLYYKSLENTMTDAAAQLSLVDYSTDRTSWVYEVSSISSGNSFDVVIRENGITVFSSSMDLGLRESPEELEESVPFDTNKDQRPNDPFRPITGEMEWSETSEGIFVGYSEDPKSDNEFIICSTHLPKGYAIFLTQPVAPIDASIVQSNLLLLIVTIIMLIVSILFALRFSKGFTRPIKEIKGGVERLSNLDFSDKLDIETGDELESLSNDVNILADRLRIALEELKEKNIQLEKDIIAQKSFISNASHELRTPLSLIKGYADELNSGYIKDKEAQTQFLEIISEESTKLNRLLNEMLDLSRLESGRMELNKEDIEVNVFIQSFLDKYSGFLKERDIKVDMDLCDECKFMHDAMRVEQILANYISNAAKYCDSKKTIVVTTKVINDKVRVSIFNYGKPINENAIDRIWDGFFRVDNARTGSGESYGLGLSIVKAIQTIAENNFGVINHTDGVEFWFEADLVIE